MLNIIIHSSSVQAACNVLAQQESDMLQTAIFLSNVEEHIAMPHDAVS